MIGPSHLKFTCWISGKPVPKKRVRFGKAAYTPKSQRAAEDRFKKKAWKFVEEQGWIGHPWEGPVSMRVYFLYNKPKDYNMAGDIDNLLKTVMDGLQPLLFKDDRQVTLIDRIVKARHSKQGTFVVVNFHTES